MYKDFILHSVDSLLFVYSLLVFCSFWVVPQGMRPGVVLWGLATLQPFLYREIIITDFSWSPLLPLFDCHCYSVWTRVRLLQSQVISHGTMGFSNTGRAIQVTRREECEDRPAAFACATWCS